MDVTSYITGNGSYNLAFTTTSNTNTSFSSREGANAPELVIVTSGGATNTPTATNTPGPSSTPTRTPTPGATNTPTITPTAPPAFSSAAFVYDGDGKRVKSTINGTITTYFVGTHFELTASTVTKYYYAGSQRIAMRTGTWDLNNPVTGTLNYMLGDHLGSTSLVTDATGYNPIETRYTAWGEVRYTSGNMPTKYQFNGQYSYVSDFGLMFYNARWVDVSLGRFAQADTIIPQQQSIQAWDRYAYTNNNPVRYTDPTGHKCVPEDECNALYGDRIPRIPRFTKSPVSKDDLEFTQWFGGTEFAYLNGDDWNYDEYCQGYHCGIDFGADWGDPVSAGVYGTVYETGKGAGGYQVIIQVGKYYILYQALDGQINVQEGDVVTPDTIIAGVGNHAADEDKGNYHLHLEVMHYSPYAIKHNSLWGWRGDLIENPLKYMDKDIYALLVSVAESSSPPNNVTFHSGEQDPLLQSSPMHRGGTSLWP